MDEGVQEQQEESKEEGLFDMDIGIDTEDLQERMDKALGKDQSILFLTFLTLGVLGSLYIFLPTPNALSPIVGVFWNGL